MRHDAMAVLREGARATPEELIAFCRGRGPLYFHPRHIAVMPAVPFNSTGKIDRAAVQARLRAAWIGRDNSMDGADTGPQPGSPLPGFQKCVPTLSSPGLDRFSPERGFDDRDPWL